MTEREAEELLGDVELVPLMQGSLASIKELRSRCLDAEIPALLYRPPKSGTS